MCEEELGLDLSEFKSFIDTEMFTILGQMDSASKIFDYLYLVSNMCSNLFHCILCVQKYDGGIRKSVSFRFSFHFMFIL